MKEAAGVAIFDRGGRLLLARHAHDGRWATVGGAVDAGEKPIDAARREVNEEVCIDLPDLTYLGRYCGSPIYDVLYPDGTVERYAVTMFATILDTRPTARPDGEEILEARWASDHDADVLDLAPDMSEIVPAAFCWFQRRIGHA